VPPTAAKTFKDLIARFPLLHDEWKKSVFDQLLQNDIIFYCLIE